MRIAPDLESLERFHPAGAYRREIEGADFSLEANTEAVPEQGPFYLLRRGRVLFKSTAFREALAAYRQLCREYWQQHLNSANLRERLASAWGLLGLDPQDREAAAVIEEEGDPQARQRLSQMRRRAATRGRLLRRRAAS